MLGTASLTFPFRFEVSPKISIDFSSGRIWLSVYSNPLLGIGTYYEVPFFVIEAIATVLAVVLILGQRKVDASRSEFEVLPKRK